MELEQTIEITNKYGLHARASTRLAQIAQKYSARILVARQMMRDGSAALTDDVDAKSVLGILSLGAERGDCIRFRIAGDDADAALSDLLSLVRQNFLEE